MTFLLGVLLIMLTNSCVSQENSTSLENLKDKNFEINTSFFPDDNNFATNAIVVNDGYIITGQKFTEAENNKHWSALVKMSLDGKLLKKEFLGNTSATNESKIESIFQLHNGTIIQLGRKKKQLWLRKIDADLNLLKDTLFPINTSIYYAPIVGAKKDKFVVVHNKDQTNNLFNISYISNDLQHSEHLEINNENSNLKYIRYRVNDGIYDPESGNFFILGEGCSKLNSEGYAEDYEYSVIVFNTNTKLVEKTILLGVGKKRTFNRLKIHKNNLYILGLSHKKLQNIPSPNYGLSQNNDILVVSYTKEGEKNSEFSYDKHLNDGPYDMTFIQDKLLIVGNTFNDKTLTNFAMCLTFSLDGALLEKRFFEPNNDGGNRLMKVIKVSNSKALLVGKGKGGWQVIVHNIQH